MPMRSRAYPMAPPCPKGAERTYVENDETDRAEQKWFDKSESTRYEEKTEETGDGTCSMATNSALGHEAVYKTNAGYHVLERSYDVEGSETTYHRLSEHEAQGWLEAQGHEEAAEDIDRYDCV